MVGLSKTISHRQLNEKSLALCSANMLTKQFCPNLTNLKPNKLSLLSMTTGICCSLMFVRV